VWSRKLQDFLPVAVGSHARGRKMQAFLENLQTKPAKVTPGMDAPILAEPRRLEEFASQLRSLQGQARSDSLAVEPLCHALMRLLDLRFVFARLGATVEPARRDMVCIHHRHSDCIQPGALAAVLAPWLARRPDVGSSFRYPPLGPEVLSITTLEFGPRSAPGRLIVGTARPVFPDDLEELLLQVAADQLSFAVLRDGHLDRQAARMLERERSKLAAELAHAGRILSLGELTASLAHEINQPLAAIVANANASRRWLERKTPNHQRARESLYHIARDGMRASDIIRRVRAFSAKGVRNRAPLNINNVIREVVALTTHEVAREHVALRTHLTGDLPAVLADRIELQQVVLNLVINSIEALRTVVDRPKDLCITSARHNKGTVAVAVRDNGNGIEAQHLQRIFDPFFTTKSHGMGLGLAISRRIVETHAGTLWATPNPECGMTLAFTLPVTRRRARNLSD
jgi:signal transduction histidine kinase